MEDCRHQTYSNIANFIIVLISSNTLVMRAQQQTFVNKSFESDLNISMGYFPEESKNKLVADHSLIIPSENVEQLLHYNEKQILLLNLSKILPPKNSRVQMIIRNSKDCYIISASQQQLKNQIKNIKNFFKMYSAKKITLKKNVYLQELSDQFEQEWDCKIFGISAIQWTAIKLQKQYHYDIKTLTKQFFVSYDGQTILVIGKKNYINNCLKKIDEILKTIKSKQDYLKQFAPESICNKKDQNFIKPQEKQQKKTFTYQEENTLDLQQITINLRNNFFPENSSTQFQNKKTTHQKYQIKDTHKQKRTSRTESQNRYQAKGLQQRSTLNKLRGNDQRITKTYSKKNTNSKYQEQDKKSDHQDEMPEQIRREMALRINAQAISLLNSGPNDYNLLVSACRMLTQALKFATQIEDVQLKLYLNRSVVYHLLGNLEQSLKDCQICFKLRMQVQKQYKLNIRKVKLLIDIGRHEQAKSIVELRLQPYFKRIIQCIKDNKYDGTITDIGHNYQADSLSYITNDKYKFSSEAESIFAFLIISWGRQSTWLQVKELFSDLESGKIRISQIYKKLKKQTEQIFYNENQTCVMESQQYKKGKLSNLHFMVYILLKCKSSSQRSKKALQKENIYCLSVTAMAPVVVDKLPWQHIGVTVQQHIRSNVELKVKQAEDNIEQPQKQMRIKQQNGNLNLKKDFKIKFGVQNKY